MLKHVFMIFTVLSLLIGLGFAKFDSYLDASNKLGNLGTDLLQKVDAGKITPQKALDKFSDEYANGGYSEYESDGILYLYDKFNLKLNSYEKILSNLNLKLNRVIKQYKDVNGIGTGSVSSVILTSSGTDISGTVQSSNLSTMDKDAVYSSMKSIYKDYLSNYGFYKQGIERTYQQNQKKFDKLLYDISSSVQSTGSSNLSGDSYIAYITGTYSDEIISKLDLNQDSISAFRELTKNYQFVKASYWSRKIATPEWVDIWYNDYKDRIDNLSVLKKHLSLELNKVLHLYNVGGIDSLGISNSFQTIKSSSLSTYPYFPNVISGTIVDFEKNMIGVNTKNSESVNVLKEKAQKEADAIFNKLTVLYSKKSKLDKLSYINNLVLKVDSISKKSKDSYKTLVYSKLVKMLKDDIVKVKTGGKNGNLPDFYFQGISMSTGDLLSGLNYTFDGKICNIGGTSFLSGDLIYIDTTFALAGTSGVFEKDESGNYKYSTFYSFTGNIYDMKDDCLNYKTYFAKENITSNPTLTKVKLIGQIVMTGSLSDQDLSNNRFEKDFSVSYFK